MLCPDFVSNRSYYSLPSANNLCLPYVHTDRHKISFLFSSIKWWKSLPLEIHISSSVDIFKHCLLKYLEFPSHNYLFYIGDRLASIYHTRLRLIFSALRHHLFQKNCCLSPACILCDAAVKDPKHYFLYCSSFAAVRDLFTSAAQLLGNRWHCASDMKKIDWFLREAARKFRELKISDERSKFFLFCQIIPFYELVSKNIF